MIHWDIKEEVDAGDWIGMYLIGEYFAHMTLLIELPTHLGRQAVCHEKEGFMCVV